jgi:archaemetzincin
MSYIYVTPIEPIKPVYYENIGQAIEGVFDIPHKILNAAFKSETAYDYSREQYNSTFLLSKVLEFLPENTNKIVGITDVDLFVPVLTFVFGEAQLNGKAAIVSISRLKNEFYGLPKNEQLLFDRIKKEVIHELGHTFGLFHCRNYECVMSSSMYVENIDLKSHDFCGVCRNTLNNNIINQLSSDQLSKL